jgi:hypothetical protein
MPRKDTRTDKLRRDFARSKEISKYTAGLFLLLGRVPERMPDPTLNLKFPANVDEIIVQAMLPDTDAVKTAFAAAGLDQTKASDRRRLLEVFCELHFGHPKKPGPKPK